jgi:hypothetical protein
MSEEPSGWAAGYAAFAGVVLVIVGFFQACAGLVAILEDEFFVVGADWTFKFDVTTWGWIHLILGIVILVSGFGIFTGNAAARTVGVLVAGLSAVVNFLWLPWYPVWAIIVIALDIAIIWALTAHGRDIQRISDAG